MSDNISLKDFLKKYTAVSYKFIDEYYEFYDMCKKSVYGINLESVINYLGIRKIEKFYNRFRSRYIENIDYIVETKNNEWKTKGEKIKNYMINLDTFERICMASKSEKANEVRDYFIILRKFIDYYKNNISTMILNLANGQPGKCVYIILVNKDKNIFKFGKADDIRKRLKTYATGTDKHPDIKFIMIVDDPHLIEKCTRDILKKYNTNIVKDRQEIYKINIDIIKSAVFDCVGIYKKYSTMFDDEAHDAYIVFDDVQDNQKYRSKTSKKKQSRISSNATKIKNSFRKKQQSKEKRTSKKRQSLKERRKSKKKKIY